MKGLTFDPAGLGKEWERCDSIRERLRDGKDLTVLQTGRTAKGQDATIPECVANQDLLQPALARLFASKLKLPSIPLLRPEVAIAYTMCQRTPDDDLVDDGAWEVRKLLRFVKRKAGRNDPSLETLIQISVQFSICFASFVAKSTSKIGSRTICLFLDPRSWF